MKKSIDLSSGLWARVERCAKHLEITVPDLVEHCLVRRIRKIESKHMTRINLEATRHGANPKPKAKAKTKKKAVAKKRKTTAKKLQAVPAAA